MKRTCFEWETIKLTQQGIDNFTVIYWKQVKSNLTYGQAACELGACIMHALACDSLLDNREKGERCQITKLLRQE